MSDARALPAARRALRALRRGAIREAAWLGLWSVELDPKAGLGLAVVARILHQVSGDHLATLGARQAILRGIPEPEATELARHLRVDLWGRGLLQHEEGQAILPMSAFDEPDRFTPTDEHDLWFEERIARWGDLERAGRALCRLVGALSDALEMPADTPDPLRSERAWADMPAFAEWKRNDPLVEPEPAESDVAAEGVPEAGSSSVLSDAWTLEQVDDLDRQGRLSEAIEVAEHWAELRPGRVGPRVALLRLLHHTGQFARLEATEAEILEAQTEDLNELEEARVELGLLGRFEAQLEILNRMNRLAPGHPGILANRGAVALELDRPEAAEADLQLALQLDPQSGPALINLGLLRMREQDYAVARGLLEQAKLLFPDEGQVRYYLATCLQHQGRTESALTEARAAVERDPGYAPAQELLDQLRAGLS